MQPSNQEQGVIKSIGDLHEASARELMGGDAENLNHHPLLEGMGLRGGNYNTYDIFSSEEACSVKARMIGNTSEPNLNSYRSEFNKMLGWNRSYQNNNLSPIQQDAQRLMACGERGVPIPEALKGATQEQVVDYLQTQSTMRVPSDHVEAVRETIIADARNLPEKYHLPENPTEQQLLALGNRIQSTGLSAEESLAQVSAQKSTQGQQAHQVSSPQDHTAVESQKTNTDNKPDREPSEEEDYDYGFRY